HLVDRDRRVERIGCTAALHPCRVVPLVLERPDARGGIRRLLAEEREGVALVGHGRTLLRHDAELVALAVTRTGGDALPDARAVAAHGERVAVGVPAVPVTD